MVANLQQLKDVNNSIPKELVVENPIEPVSQLVLLDGWLQTHDCTVEETDAVLCYKLTRTKLIKTTRALDAASDLVYTSQVVIKGLMGSIDQIVNQVSGTINVFDPQSLKIKAQSAMSSVKTKIDKTINSTTQQ